MVNLSVAEQRLYFADVVRHNPDGLMRSGPFGIGLIPPAFRICIAAYEVVLFLILRVVQPVLLPLGYSL